MAQVKRIFVIGNPLANGGRLGTGFDALIEAFHQRGLHPDFVLTRHPLEAMTVARKAAGGYDIVVAAGGDGTMHEVANGLLTAEGDIRAALAVLPLGTGNDFAQVMGVAALDDALAALQLGAVAPMDVIEVRCTGTSGEETRYALLYAATGIAADLTRLCTPGLKRLFGPRYSYTIAVVRALLRFRPALTRVTVNGEVHARRMLLVSAGNVEVVGGGAMRLSPGARPDDGRFEVNLVEALSWREIPGCFRRLMKGTHTGHPRVNYLSATELNVESQPPLALQLDGEAFGRTPARFVMRPGALRVVRLL